MWKRWETLELVVKQAKTLGEDKKLATDSMAVLEEASNARNLARDDYDAKRWKEELADAREILASSRTTIINSINDETPNTIDGNKTLAVNTDSPTAAEPASTKIIPVADSKPAVSVPVKNDVSQKKEIAENKAPEKSLKSEETEKQTKTESIAQKLPKDNSVRDRLAADESTPEEEKTVQPIVKTEDTAKAIDSSPLQIGSLIEYATDRVAPSYPAVAKTMRMTGVVKVEVLVNEDGSIAEVQNASGPSMLQRAATDAIKKWKFKPFTRDGQPVKATGFVSFNFNL